MENRHGLEKSGHADFFGLSQRMAEAENEYNAAIAQAEYTGEYELAAALYKEKVRVQEALTEAEIRQQQYALEQYQLKYQAGRDSVADQQYDREQALKEKTQADDVALAWAAQILKEKDQADSSALAWAEQVLKEKTQNDELELAWAELTKEEQLALLEHALAQKKQEEAAALDWAAQNLAQEKHDDSKADAQKEQLIQTGEMYLKAGLMPPAEMLEAVGITEADARRYIVALNTSKR